MPDFLYALPAFFAGETEPLPEEELRTQSQGETPLIHEGILPTIPGNLSLGSERACYHEKVCGGTTVATAHKMLNLSRTCRRGLG